MPLLYGADQRPVVATEDEKARALLVLAFGALKGLHRGPGGTAFVEDEEELTKYRNHVAAKVVELVGAQAVEQYYGVRLTLNK